MIKHFIDINALKEIPRGVWGVSIGCMLIAISTTMTFSISPFFVTEVLGLSMLSLGFMEGASEALAQFSKLLSGFSGDFFHRKKPPLIVGAVLATISKPIFILAGSAGPVMLSKIIERISNGIMATPRDAYVAEAASADNRGASLGLMMTLKTLGCTIGSLLIGLLMIFMDDYRTLLWLGFIPCLLSIFVLYKYMTENESAREPRTQKEKTEAKISFKDFKNLDSRYWSLIGVATLFMCARFSDGFLILRLNELGAPKWLSASTIGIFNIICVLSCLPIGRLSDRFDRSKILYFSFIALVLSNLCFIGNSLWIGLVGVIMWGAQRGTSQVLFAAMIADEAPKKIMGTAMGIFYFITGVIAFSVGPIAGHLADTALIYAFYFGLGASTLSLIMLFIRNEYFARKGRREGLLGGVSASTTETAAGIA